MMASLKLALALVIVAGAAAVLLPGWAPAQPDPNARLGVQQTAQPPGNLDKIKQDLDRAAKELARTKADLDLMTKDYEAKVAALKAAMEQVKRAEEPPVKLDAPAFGKGFGGGNLDKRLGDIELFLFEGHLPVSAGRAERFEGVGNPNKRQHVTGPHEDVLVRIHRHALQRHTLRHAVALKHDHDLVDGHAHAADFGDDVEQPVALDA